MKATINYLVDSETKESTVDNFKSIYTYEKYVEVRGVDSFGIENSIKIPKENLVSINIK